MAKVEHNMVSNGHNPGQVRLSGCPVDLYSYEPDINPDTNPDKFLICSGQPDKSELPIPGQKTSPIRGVLSGVAVSMSGVILSYLN